MSAKSKHRGHEIECHDNVWVYSDNRIPVSRDKNRPCGHCGKSSTPEGHDGCLGTLTGVMNACCGHGETEEAYIQFLDGSRLSGESVFSYLRKSGVLKHRELTPEETDKPLGESDGT